MGFVSKFTCTKTGGTHIEMAILCEVAHVLLSLSLAISLCQGNFQGN